MERYKGSLMLATKFVDEIFLPLYEIVHDVTIGMVEAMPEEHLGFRPTDSMRSFQETVVHISSVERAFALGAAGEGWDFEAQGYRPKNYQGRTALWNLVLQTRDEVLSLARTIDSERIVEPIGTPYGFALTPAQLLLLLRDHTNNHNGKLSVYVRMVGAEPPFFLSLTRDALDKLQISNDTPTSSDPS